MHPKSVLFMGTICPLAAIFASVGRSSHRSRLARRGVRTRYASRFDSNESHHLRAPRNRTREKSLRTSFFNDVHTHGVPIGEIRQESAPSPIETGSIKKSQKIPARDHRGGPRHHAGKKHEKNTGSVVSVVSVVMTSTSRRA